MDARLGLLLDGLAEAYNRKSWHGPNLHGSLRGVTSLQALWRPGVERHNIWELTLHAAYWKYVVRRRVTGMKRGSFVLKGSNFFSRDAGSPAQWQEDLSILQTEHDALVAAVEQMDPGLMARHTHLIRGAAAHDLYHAGQIQLIKRMMV